MRLHLAWLCVLASACGSVVPGGPDAGGDSDAGVDSSATDHVGEDAVPDDGRLEDANDDGEAEDGTGCTSATECDDRNLCNGSEFCSPDDGTCRPGELPPDGTACAPGMACMDGSCVPATCGDGVRQDPEDCDDRRNGDPNDGCRDDCTFSCRTDTDCDDGQICNGAEPCGAGHRCLPGTAAPLGTLCDNGVFCDGPDSCDGAGTCRRSGRNPCDDGLVCTLDLCNESSRGCAHPMADDGTPCEGGLCCRGVCRLGAECCSPIDCPQVCRGTATPCTDVSTLDGCVSQEGCHPVTSGTCGEPGGTPRNCDFTLRTRCETCGCTWLVGYDTCSGAGPSPCSVLDVARCAECGCLWVSEGPNVCEGTARDCATFSDDAGCLAQSGCRWENQNCDSAWRCE